MATRNKSKVGKRSETGRFKKECSCLNHGYFIGDCDNFFLCNTKHLKARRTYQALVEKNLVKLSHTYVCNKCLEYAADHYVNTCTSKENSVEETIDQFLLISEIQGEDDQLYEQDTGLGERIESETEKLEEFLHLLKQMKGRYRTLVESERIKLELIAKALGEIISTDLYSNGIEVSKQYKDFNFIKNTKPQEWAMEQNSLLVAFLCGACNIDLKTCSDKKTNALVHTLEEVLYARNLLVITPFAFMRNLVTYTVTHSKTAVQLAGAWEPSGGYTTILSRMKEDYHR